MDKEVVIERLSEVIKQKLEIALPDQLMESNRLFEDLNIDSIMVLQLIVYIEEAFGVQVPEEDVDPAAFQTVGLLIAFIQGLMQSKSRTAVND
jgi:aryl carrier protein AsbD